MVNPNRFYTYAYLREDKTPYYIGKGTRYRAFVKAKKYFQPPKDKSRIIYLKQNLTEEEAFRHEVYMIAIFGRIDLGTGILYNRTAGGDGISGMIHSGETIEKFREINTGKNNPFYGKSHSNETKSIMSEKTKKLWKLTFSDGRNLIIFGISSWAKENGYDAGALRKLRSGKVKYHKDIVLVEKLTQEHFTDAP